MLGEREVQFIHEKFTLGQIWSSRIVRNQSLPFNGLHCLKYLLTFEFESTIVLYALGKSSLDHPVSWVQHEC